jgi:hypothetical protein
METTLLHREITTKHYKKKMISFLMGINSSTISKMLQTTNLLERTRQSASKTFSKRKPSKDMDAITEYVKASEKNYDIIFWESKQLTKKPLVTFSHATVKAYLLPQSLFAFLDAIQPEHTKTLLHLYHQALTHTEAEMILAMLTRQVRLLLAISEESIDPIEEVKRLAPWQKNKLLSQSRQFSLQKLQNLHSQLYALDVQSKTGGLSLPLSQSIDFFLASI